MGLPAEVVTNRMPWPATNSTMSGSRTKAWAMLTPNGLSVRSRMARISSRTASSSPDEVSMMPMAPALETADASGERAIHPMGACTMGRSTPRSSVTRLEKGTAGPYRVMSGHADARLLFPELQMVRSVRGDPARGGTMTGRPTCWR